jgi:hypothetical protein
MRSTPFMTLLLSAAVLAAPLLAQEEPEGIPNWPAPLFWSLTHAAEAPTERVEQMDERGRPVAHTESVAAVPTAPLPFIAVAPCRIVDTRRAAGNFGGPELVPGSSRNFPLPLGPCTGIPPDAGAYSLNFTVTNTTGPGDIRVYPQGGILPLVSTLNYVAGQTVANAAIVPAGTDGGISVRADVHGADLIIDFNGYYASQALVSSLNTLFGDLTLAEGTGITITPSAGTLTIASTGGSGGLQPTGSADNTLRYNGSAWVANGALTNDGTDVTVGAGLTLPAAVRVKAGAKTFLHNSGVSSLFLGIDAGNLASTGNNNTALGTLALNANTSGFQNVAVGDFALRVVTTTCCSTAVGSLALPAATGAHNTAVGAGALQVNTAGADNIAIGFLAGGALTTGSNNICLGNAGVAGESNTIRIGPGNSSTRIFIDGIRDRITSPDGVTVVVDSAGQLGTIASSARFKEDVEDMADASSRLLQLRPVTFHYKGRPSDRKQFGLIAEEVEEVLPDLVVCDSGSEVETVLYHEMPAMLLNELQKQERKMKQQAVEMERQAVEIEQLKAALAALQRAVTQR